MMTIRKNLKDVLTTGKGTTETPRLDKVDETVNKLSSISQSFSVNFDSAGSVAILNRLRQRLVKKLRMTYLANLYLKRFVTFVSKREILFLSKHSEASRKVTRTQVYGSRKV